MKVGIVYTSTTKELIEEVNRHISNELGSDIEILSYQDPSILSEVIEYGGVSSTAVAKLIKMYADAMMDEVDVILNACSSVSEVADAVQSIAQIGGVPVVRIDEEMCRLAVINGKRIAVMATLETTLKPTVGTLNFWARSCNKKIEVTEILIENAFGINQDDFKSKLLYSAEKYAMDSDVILLAQGSMSYCEKYLQERTGKIVLSSPSNGARALRYALEKKGLI